MAILFDVPTRNARLNTIESTNATATNSLCIWEGTPPTACSADEAGGTFLVYMALPASWLSAAANGTAGIDGVANWTATCHAAGTAQYFRIYNTTGTTATPPGQANCFMQGAITADMNLDNTNLATGQTVSVTAFTLTDGNA